MKKRIIRGVVCAVIVTIMVIIWQPVDGGVYVFGAAITGACLDG
jgi:phosphotransferase system  glucose/maltose/N-acetylglucosamine-specific IIC component